MTNTEGHTQHDDPEMVPKADIEDLIDRWRSQGADRIDRRSAGAVIEECADELEVVIDG